MPHCYGTQEIVHSRFRMHNHRAGRYDKILPQNNSREGVRQKNLAIHQNHVRRCGNHGIELKSSSFNSIYADIYLSAYQLRSCKIVGNSILIVSSNVFSSIWSTLLERVTSRLASFVASSDIMIGQATIWNRGRRG